MKTLKRVNRKVSKWCNCNELNCFIITLGCFSLFFYKLLWGFLVTHPVMFMLFIIYFVVVLTVMTKLERKR